MEDATLAAVAATKLRTKAKKAKKERKTKKEKLNESLRDGSLLLSISTALYSISRIILNTREVVLVPLMRRICGTLNEESQHLP